MTTVRRGSAPGSASRTSAGSASSAAATSSKVSGQRPASGTAPCRPAAGITLAAPVLDAGHREPPPGEEVRERRDVPPVVRRPPGARRAGRRPAERGAGRPVAARGVEVDHLVGVVAVRGGGVGRDRGMRERRLGPRRRPGLLRRRPACSNLSATMAAPTGLGTGRGFGGPGEKSGRWRGRYQAGDVRGHGDITLGEGKRFCDRGPGASHLPGPHATDRLGYPASVSPSTRAARSTSANPTYSGVKPNRRTSGRAEVADHAPLDQPPHHVARRPRSAARPGCRAPRGRPG